MKQRICTIYRVWQGIACRLRRRGAVASLIVLLTIGLIEPLACIIHCELQAVFAQAAAHPADMSLHHHNHRQNTNVDLAADGVAIAPAVAAPPGCPLLHSSNAPASELPAPQPFHEMALLAIVLLPLIAPRRRGRRASRIVPPDCAPSPHFRPPILCA